MGKVVGGFGQAHILFDDHGIEEQGARVFEGFKEIGETIRALNPDVVVIISDDHMYNINSAIEVPLAVGVADAYETFGDMNCPHQLYQGHRDFGQGFVNFAADNNFDLVKLEREGFKLDHGFSIPAMFISPNNEIPIVPINVNINMSPSPTPRRCYQLGSTLKAYIEEVRPADERVVVVGSGGLSHWLMIEGDGNINEEYDKQVLADFCAGQAHKYAEMSTEEMVEISGNGGTELKNWLVMAATVPGKKGRQLFYEPVYPWKTGCGAVEIITGH